MTDTLIKVDLAKSPVENENIHNRWHPDIPMACWVNPGDLLVVDLLDTSSRHVPGVQYAGPIHPGLIGCLPDKPMLDLWNAREAGRLGRDALVAGSRLRPLRCRPATAPAPAAVG
jgi:acetamidase/formamidase